MGRRVSRHVPHHFQNNRRDNQRCDGLHNRPHAHQAGQSPSVAAAFGAARCDNRHSAFHRSAGKRDCSGRLGHALLQPVLFAGVYDLQYVPQPYGSAVHPQHRSARFAFRFQSDFDHYDERHNRRARFSDGCYARYRHGQTPLDSRYGYAFNPCSSADAP